MGPAAPGIAPGNPADDELKGLWDWNMTNHTPTPDGIRKMEGMRSTAKAMKDAIIDMAPHSRERSLALTNLEQALFYANAAIARNFTADRDDTPEEDKALANEDKPNNDKKES